MAFIAASLGGIKVTRYEKLRPLALLEGKMAKANNLQGSFAEPLPIPLASNRARHEEYLLALASVYDCPKVHMNLSAWREKCVRIL
jgi:hypothetical protein